MAKDKRCKCTFTQSLVGDGCRYCQSQEHIDRLYLIIKDMEEEYDKLFNEKATVWNLTANKKEWQELTDDDIQAMWKFYDGKYYDFYTAIEAKLKEKNHG